MTCQTRASIQKNKTTRVAKAKYIYSKKSFIYIKSEEGTCAKFLNKLL